MMQHAEWVTGEVLEIQKPEYASLCGRNIRRVDTHLPTFVCDLAIADDVLPREAYDCILTEVTALGHSLSAVAAMMGVAAEELTPAELDAHDPRFPVLVTLAAHAPRRE